MAEAANQRPYDDDEINLLDYWRVIWKSKWLIGALCSTSVIAAMVFGLLTPKIYESTATIIIPKESGGGGFLSALGASGIAQQIAGVSLPSLTPNRDIFMSILKSRTLALKLVAQFNLKDYYKALHLEDAINSVQGATNVSMSKGGLIVIKVEDTDPKMAADIANAYPDHLDRFMTNYGTGAAGRQRRFIEGQLVKTEDGLKKAEEVLRQFQEKNQAVVMPAQTRQAIQVAARLKGEIMASKVQLQMVRNFATDANPEVIRLRRRIEELKRQLAQAQYGVGLELPAVTDNPGHPQMEIFLSTAKVPKIGLELTRLARGVKIQETVYTLLTQQLEQVKIAEAKDMPVVQVLDRAVPALRKSKPKIKLQMALAGAVSLFLGIFLAFLLEYIQRQRAAEQPSIVNSQ